MQGCKGLRAFFPGSKIKSPNSQVYFFLIASIYLVLYQETAHASKG